MTPNQHKAQAEALLDAVKTTSPDVDYQIIEAHAALGKAAGTGDHYAAADAALASAAAMAHAGGKRESYRVTARTAAAHAALAD